MTEKQLTFDGLFAQVEKHPENGLSWRSNYRRGCRCEWCVSERRSYYRRYVRKRKEIDPNYHRDISRKHRATENGRQKIRERARKNSENPAFRCKSVMKSRRRALRHKGRISALKMEAGCIDCGYKENPVALDFDHVIGKKTINVGAMGTFSLKRVREEIAKCEIRCLRCHRIATKKRMLNGEHAWATKPKNDRRNTLSRENRNKKKKFIADLKIERGCADCGYKSAPEAMDFDHVHGVKKMHVSSVQGSIESILAEIEKCEVVCANCHRIRTYNRHQARKAEKAKTAC